MTSVLASRTSAALRRAAIRATYAPSVHNTQPWRFELRPGELNLVADRARQLRVVDPTGRQMMISLGCAVFNARVALASAQLTAHVERFPAGETGEVVARFLVDGESVVRDSVAGYDAVIEERQTNRRRFAEENVPSDVIGALVDAAALEEAILLPVRSEQDRITLARLSQYAERIQAADSAYQAELRTWTSADPLRLDGVPASAVPHADGTARDDIPLRDFDTTESGELPADAHSSMHQCLLLLGTRADRARDWVRAGEALERVLLEITRRGYSVSPFTQLVEVAATRNALRTELGIDWWPHVLLRVGRAPYAPGTRRRRLVDVLHEST